MVLEFIKGIPGFENYKKFKLENVKDYEGFSILSSLDDSDIGFVCISPFLVRKDYDIEIPEEVVNFLEIEEETDPFDGNVLVLCLVKLGKYVKDSLVNLQAPIIINIRNKKACQYIINDDKYSTRENILEGSK